MVNPRLFEDCIVHAAEKLRVQLGFGLRLNPVRLTRCLKEFQSMIEIAQDEEMTPDTPDLVDLYAQFCTILSKSNLVSHTDMEDGSVVDFRKAELKHNISNVLAVSFVLSLFQDEFIVDYVQCQIPRELVFTLARRMRRTPSMNVFEIPVLDGCRYLDQRVY